MLIPAVSLLGGLVETGWAAGARIQASNDEAELNHCKGRTEQEGGRGRLERSDSEVPDLGDWTAENVVVE